MTLPGFRRRLSVVMVVSVCGGGRPVRACLEACARLFGPTSLDMNGIYVGPRSQAWLRRSTQTSGNPTERSDITT
jgi:hypothetical protein